jgi:hypothetical protein
MHPRNKTEPNPRRRSKRRNEPLVARLLCQQSFAFAIADLDVQLRNKVHSHKAIKEPLLTLICIGCTPIICADEGSVTKPVYPSTANCEKTESPQHTFVIESLVQKTSNAAMTEQPVPIVTAEDVPRIIAREFGVNRVEEVQRVLCEYGKQSWHRDSPRVHLAILKLSVGDMTELRQQTNVACDDCRDVLSPAEYQQYARVVLLAHATPDAVSRAISEDWKEYQTWLNHQ